MEIKGCLLQHYLQQPKNLYSIASLEIKQGTVKNTDPVFFCLQEIHLNYSDTNSLKINGVINK